MKWYFIVGIYVAFISAFYFVITMGLTKASFGEALRSAHPHYLRGYKGTSEYDSNYWKDKGIKKRFFQNPDGYDGSKSLLKHMRAFASFNKVNEDQIIFNGDMRRYNKVDEEPTRISAGRLLIGAKGGDINGDAITYKRLHYDYNTDRRLFVVNGEDKIDCAIELLNTIAGKRHPGKYDRFMNKLDNYKGNVVSNIKDANFIEERETWTNSDYYDKKYMHGDIYQKKKMDERL